MKPQKTNRNRSRHGGTLLSIVIGLMLVSILGASMAQLLHRSGRGQAQAYDIARARYLAESGINYAIASGQLDAFSNSQTAHVRMLAAMEGFSVAVTQQTNGLYDIVAVGSTGIGSGRETHQQITRSGLGFVPWDPDAGPPDVVESTVAPIVEEIAYDEYGTWNQKSMKGFIYGEDSSGGSGSDLWIETQLNATDDMYWDWLEAGGWDHYVGLQFFNMNTINQLNAAWQENNQQISYEVQVKMMWDYDRWYGAQGLAVALVNTDRHVTDWKTESYNVSLMRYANEAELGDYNATFDYTYDGIPNSLKPPGLAGHRLLVVWMQGASGNKLKWIAYKDLDHYTGLPGEDAVDWIVDWDDGISGQCFKDYATLAARMIESRTAGGEKYRYLQVLRADPKTGIARAANTVAEDINRNRKAYLPMRYGGTFPEWSPIDFKEWNTELDYFTPLLSSSGIPLEQIQWDGVNIYDPTEIAIMPDNGTIRINDAQSADVGTWNRNKHEIGFTVSGNFNNAMDNKVYFDEIAVRFLKNNYADTEVPGVQY